jgi:threonine dehydratase
MHHFPTIAAYLGSPLVRLQRLPGKTSNIILAKLEGKNFAGSIKGRPALSMIVEVENAVTYTRVTCLLRPPVATLASLWRWLRLLKATSLN